MERALVDRRPSARINCYAGSFTQSNPQGLASWWRYDRDHTLAVNDLVAFILAKLNAGIDVIALNRWTGECQAQGAIIASECWNTLPAGRQAALISILKPWWAARVAENPNRRLGLYVSNMIRNDRDITKLCPGGDDDAHVHAPNMLDPLDVAYIHALWDPLIDLGMTFCWADNATRSDKQASVEAQYDAWRADFFDVPVDLVSEAIPRVTGNKDQTLNYMPDASRLYRQPSMAFWRYVRAQEAFNLGQRAWEIDARISDVTVCLTSDESFNGATIRGEHIPGDPGPVPPTRADVQSLLRRGFKVASSWDPVDPWVEGLTRAPEPEDVAFVNGVGGNTVTWTAGSATDELGVAIAVEFYEVFRADAEEGPYVRIGTTSELTYLDPTGTPSHFYQVGSWTEYNAASIPIAAAAPDEEEDPTLGWSFGNGVWVLEA
jgi:hypothetical protein